MSHRWLKNKNPVKAARDKGARDERARAKSLRESDSSTHLRGHLLLNLSQINWKVVQFNLLNRLNLFKLLLRNYPISCKLKLRKEPLDYPIGILIWLYHMSQ